MLHIKSILSPFEVSRTQSLFLFTDATKFPENELLPEIVITPRPKASNPIFFTTPFILTGLFLYFSIAVISLFSKSFAIDFTVSGVSLVPFSVSLFCKEAPASFSTMTVTALVKTSFRDGFRYAKTSASLNGIVSAETAGKDAKTHKNNSLFILYSLSSIYFSPVYITNGLLRTRFAQAIYDSTYFLSISDINVIFIFYIIINSYPSF